ncbi:aminopeptidase 2, M18 family [Gottschalkia acidurici 9a]|uniref:M18 family aminopeptidase n=1 Tax=Gottschalkia acidurici (strain ATCC 7906 / DSM 604 / BCRC 14475 / CIP 104303 / KCTC 5404 / NCIMB 10678 / 9a) TaxID=1128398 RepID=K0AZR5_GOTA9|nr:M18 family aminopeptidase [Gottschalkia acidurici]AFS78769.1 aminopeptidase 2, M18 family [Gottschalkia acidurici 9a]
MTREIEFAQDLINFIYDSPSAFHVVENIKNILLDKGFQELKLRDRWNVQRGRKYFTTKNDSSIIAFTVGEGSLEEHGFRIIGSHTDFPNFKIKPNPEIVSEKSYLKLNTEVYGGPILNTWLDRPLSIAGRVTLKSEDVLYPVSKNINIRKPLMIIPNLSIHMNRNVNEGIKLSKQKDMLPLVSMINDNLEKDNFLINLLSEELNVSKEDIIDFDLYLYEFDKGSIVGLNNDFISCGRLDNLAMVHASINALLEAGVSKSTNVAVCFDNEEIGSSTKQGADSPMLKTILERISISLGKDKEDFYRSLYSSFIISADMAHAVHPNSPEKHDLTNRPILNKGPVIKISANQSYTTDSDSNTVYELICKNSGVPVQKFVNHSDQRGGSTIGPINSTHLDIRSVDMGNPVLGMHSIRELGGVDDHYYTKKLLKSFIGYSLKND